MKIKFWTRYDERKNIHYSDEAQVESRVPAVGDEVWFCGCREIVDAVRPAWIDAEQPRSEVYDYDIYVIEVHDADDDEDDGAWRYIAVKKSDEEEDEF